MRIFKMPYKFIDTIIKCFIRETGVEFVSSKARTSVLVTLNKKNYDRSNSEFLKISKYHN